MAARARVHLVGVGGAGMSAIARILLDRGVPVSGSDARASATTEALAARGARVTVGHDAGAVAGAGVVVASSAVRAGNPELLAAREAGVPVVHRSAALAALMTGDRAVTVTGTHGKTTTTSMITTAARAAGVDASYAIGGDLVADGVNARHGTAGVFVAEADESDGSFLAYAPDVCVVGNVEADHLDHYGTPEAVRDAFAALAGRILPDGVAVAGTDDPGAADWARAVAAARPDVRVVRVGRGDGDAVRIVDTGPLAPVPELVHGGARHALHLAVPGRHNVTNAALAFAASVAGLGLDPTPVLRGLAAFTGARRRFDRRGVAGGVTVVDDYAHHPTEVAAAVATAREVAGTGRVHVLFQPHLYSRTVAFAADFARALAAADTVVALDVYAAREDPRPGVDGGLVVAGVPHGRFVPDRSRAVAALAAAAAPGDLVLTVGAGDVGELGEDLLAALGAAGAGGTGT
ncbi:MAG: UDP-N-acetylmuramate--L-alanine ligase [Kineosporiaceae bacterium]